MKAVYASTVNHADPLAALAVGEQPEPQARPFWSTVSVRAVTVNHHDVWSLQGVGLAAEQTPMILGTDAVGILDEDIPGKHGLKAGSEVVLYTFVGTDGAGVAPGERRTILSEKYPGTMAEKTSVPSANVFAKPASLTTAEAAALGTSWLTPTRCCSMPPASSRATPCSFRARAAACPLRPSSSPMPPVWKCSSPRATRTSAPKR